MVKPTALWSTPSANTYGKVSIANRVMQATMLGEQGQKDEAVRRLREIEQEELTAIGTVWSSLRAFYEGRREECLESAERAIEEFPDPEGFWQMARVLAYFGERERAIALLDRSFDRGFILYRVLTREDPCLDPLRATPEFARLLRRAESRYREAVAAFRDAGGEELLGVDAG